MSTELGLAIPPAGGCSRLLEGNSASFIQVGGLLVRPDFRAHWARVRSQAEKAKEYGHRVVVLLPLLQGGHSDVRLMRLLDSAVGVWADEVVASSLGSLWGLGKRDLPCPVTAGDFVKCFCSADAEVIADLGASKIRVTFEMNRGQVSRLAENSPIPLQATVHGRVTLGVLQDFAQNTLGAGTETLVLAGVKGGGALYEVHGKEMVSARSLMLLAQLGELRSVGVRSFLIDARYLTEKHAECALRSYGLALKAVETGEASADLLAALADSVRETLLNTEFCNGWFFGKPGRDYVLPDCTS